MKIETNKTNKRRERYYMSKECCVYINSDTELTDGQFKLYEIVANGKGTLSSDVRKILKISIHSASIRLNKLYKMKIFSRVSIASPSGGYEYKYYIITKNEGHL